MRWETKRSSTYSTSAVGVGTVIGVSRVAYSVVAVPFRVYDCLGIDISLASPVNSVVISLWPTENACEVFRAELVDRGFVEATCREPGGENRGVQAGNFVTAFLETTSRILFASIASVSFKNLVRSYDVWCRFLGDVLRFF